jgi:hypothetical protein
MPIWELPDNVSITLHEKGPVVVVNIDSFPFVVSARLTVEQLKETQGLQWVCVNGLEMNDTDRLDEQIFVNSIFTASDGSFAMIRIGEFPFQISPCFSDEACNDLSAYFRLPPQSFSINGNYLEEGETYVVHDQVIIYTVTGFGFMQRFQLGRFAKVQQLVEIVQKEFGVSPIILMFRGFTLDFEKPLSLYEVAQAEWIMAVYNFESARAQFAQVCINGKDGPIFVFELPDRDAIRWRFRKETTLEKVAQQLLTVIKRPKDGAMGFRIGKTELDMKLTLEKVNQGTIRIFWAFLILNQTRSHGRWN